MAHKTESPYQYDYDPQVVSDRINKARTDAGLTVKEVAQEIWPQQGDNARSSWHKKTKNQQSSWELLEIKKVAQLLGAPPGWPFLDWNYAETLCKLVSRSTKG